MRPSVTQLDLSRRRLGAVVPAGGEPMFRRLAAFMGFGFRHGTRESWDDAEALPSSGGVLVVANHISLVDPVAVCRYLIWHGRWPRFLGKEVLWRTPIVGALARGCSQIPVVRGTAQAKDSLLAAIRAVEAGECVVIYPEGTRTKDPDLWPMRPRTGAARLALDTGAPVIPIAHWGTEAIMPGRRLTFPRVIPRRPIRIIMGKPVDLDDLRGQSSDPAAVREAGRRIMAAITALVAELRGVDAPDGVWDSRRGVRIPLSER